MNPLAEHVQQNLTFYVIGIVVGIACIYATQRHSLPIIFHVVEMGFYCLFAHSCIFIGAVFASWFQAEAFVGSRSIEEVEAMGEGTAPLFATPLVKVWVRADYTPDWLYFLEIGVFCLIILGVALFRPIEFGKKREAPAKPGERPQAAGRFQRPTGHAQRRRK